MLILKTSKTWMHYTDPTGPDQTRTADCVGDPGLVGSCRARVVEFSYYSARPCRSAYFPNISFCCRLYAYEFNVGLSNNNFCWRFISKNSTVHIYSVFDQNCRWNDQIMNETAQQKSSIQITGLIRVNKTHVKTIRHVLFWYIYTVSQKKTRHQTLAHNFPKW